MIRNWSLSSWFVSIHFGICISRDWPPGSLWPARLSWTFFPLIKPLKLHHFLFLLINHSWASLPARLWLLTRFRRFWIPWARSRLQILPLQFRIIMGLSHIQFLLLISLSQIFFRIICSHPIPLGFSSLGTVMALPQALRMFCFSRVSASSWTWHIALLSLLLSLVDSILWTCKV